MEDEYAARKAIVRELNTAKKGRLREDNLYLCAAISVVLCATIFGVIANGRETATDPHGAGRPDFMGPRILVSDKESLSSKAKTYQEKYGSWKDEGFYSHWAQQVGESYTSYKKGGDLFTETEKVEIQHAYCDTGKPVSRIHHTSNVIPVAENTSYLFDGVPLKSHLLLFGGQAGKIKSDAWVFVNGVIDGVEWNEGENASKITYNPLNGDSCNECPSRKSCTGKSGVKMPNGLEGNLQCNACNKWRRIKLGVLSRAALDCNLYETWCPTLDASAHWKAVRARPELSRSQHAAGYVYNNVDSNAIGTVFVYGGVSINDGLTGSLWYLSKIPMPVSGEVQPDSLYAQGMHASWHCAKVFGDGENTTSYSTSIYRKEQTACSSAMPENITQTNGTIDSGIPNPQHRCSWVITPSTGTEIITFHFNRLDLSVDELKRCSNYVHLQQVSLSSDGETKTLVRMCELSQVENNFFSTSPNSKLVITLVYDHICPSHSGMSGDYSIIEPSVSPELLKCSPTCPDILPCLNVCHDNGVCRNGKCHCHRGFYGSNCEYKCTRHDKCTDPMQDMTIQMFPGKMSGHTMLPTYRKTVSKVVKLVDSGGAHPTGTCQVTVAPLPSSANASEELGAQYGFVSHNTSSNRYTFTDGNSTRHVTHTESWGTTEGLTRLVVFGGWTGRQASNELWTLDVQDQLLDDWTTEGDCPLPHELRNCSNVSLSVCIGNGRQSSSRHPKFPILPRWNKWTKRNIVGPKGRYGHSAILTGRYRSSASTLVSESALGDRMVLFGGITGVGVVLNDLWELNIPQGHGQTFSWTEVSVDTISVTKFVCREKSIVRMTLASAVPFKKGAYIYVKSSSKKVLRGDWVISEVVDSVTVEFNVSQKRKFESSSYGAVRGAQLVVGETFLGGEVISKPFPQARAYHASAMYKNISTSKSNMVMYGGFNGKETMNDVWVLNVNEADESKYVWHEILHGESGRGSWVAGIGLEAVWVAGVRMMEYKAKEMPRRYGHSLDLVTSAIDHKGGYSEVFLNFGGSRDGAISSSDNEDPFGTPYGGKYTSAFYLCPDVDLACAHSTFVGAARGGLGQCKLEVLTALVLGFAFVLNINVL